MWKKSEVRLIQQNVLKRSEGKRLRELLLSSFTNMNEEQLNSLLPPKEEISVAKIAHPSPQKNHHLLLYSVQKQPLFFDIDLKGRGDLFPTVYALWKIPNMMPVIVIHPPVFKYLLRGADLMWPGVVLPQGGIPALGTFEIDSKFAIVIEGSSSVVAVGRMAMSSKELAKQGLKGKAIKLIHFYRDNLWKYGSKEDPPLILPENDGESDEEEEEEQQDETEGKNEDKEKEKEKEKEKNEIEQKQSSQTIGESTSQTDDQKNEENKEKAESEKNETLNSESESKEGEKVAEVGPESMDLLLNQCFLEAIKSSIKDRDLPILLSSFWSLHMLPCRPPGTTIDIKKSSFKKLSKFIEAAEKQGFVKTNEPSKGVIEIVAINRDHEEYKKYRPGKYKQQAEASSKAEEPSTSFSVLELFKTSSGLIPLFEEFGFKKDQLFLQKDVQEILWKYVAAHSLSSPSGKEVKLDLLLAVNLFKDKTKENSLLSKKDLLSKFLEKMQKFHQVSRGNLSEVKKGAVVPIRIAVKQRQGRKHVTEITGLEGFLVSPEDVANELQHVFAASTSVQPLPAKGAGKEVLIQGNVLKRVADHLTTKYDIPKKYVEVMEGKKK